MTEGSSFPFDIIPFIISIFVEIISPVVTSALEERTGRKIDKEYEGAGVDERENLKKLFRNLNGFVLDGVSTISGFAITVATAVSIPLLRARSDLAFYLMVILLALLFLIMLYFAKADPTFHGRRRIGPYSWFGIGAIASNFIFIYLLAVQWNLARLPF